MASLLYLFLATLALATGAPSGEKCCSEKMVGGVEYRYVKDGMTGAYGCLADCIYERVDSPGSMFCFAAGDLEVVCEDAPYTGDPSNTTESQGAGVDCRFAVANPLPNDTLISGSPPDYANPAPENRPQEAMGTCMQFNAFCGAAPEDRPICTCPDGSQWRHPYFLAQCSDGSGVTQCVCPNPSETFNSLDNLFRESGIVPTFIENAPERLMMVSWDSGVTLTRLNSNQTIDTGDIMNAPSVMFKSSFDQTSLYTIMIVDFGVNRDGANVVHWLVSNVPGGDISQGDENIDYLPPFSYEADANGTQVANTGDAAIHQTAVLAFRQSGQISVETNLAGCNQAAIFGRRIDVSSFISQYNLSGPEQGNLFWTKYSAGTDELFCYSTKCTGIPFPFPLPGINDLPECSQ